MPSIRFGESIRNFAGVRANVDTGDFVIGEAEGAPGFIDLDVYKRQMYGLCGFEISESYFKQNFAQPTGFDRLSCLLAPAGDGLAADAAFHYFCCATASSIYCADL